MSGGSDSVLPVSHPKQPGKTTVETFASIDGVPLETQSPKPVTKISKVTETLMRQGSSRKLQPRYTPNPQSSPRMKKANIPVQNHSEERSGSIIDWSFGSRVREENSANKWRYSICSCFASRGNCVITAVLPFVTEYRIARQSDQPRSAKAIGYLVFAFFLLEMTRSVVFTFGLSHELRMLRALRLPIVLAMAGVVLARVLIVVKLRERVRVLRTINGSTWRDLTAVCCCYFCALCQMKSELDYNEHYHINFDV